MRWLSARLLAALLSALPALALADFTFAPALAARQAGEMDLIDIELCGDHWLAVGERGLIVRSVDGGQSWQQSEAPVSQHLTAVDCLASGVALAVGHGGVILRSTDGGVSWNRTFDGKAANEQWLGFAKQELARLDAELAAAGDEADDDLVYAQDDAAFAVEDAEAAIGNGPADPFLAVKLLDANRALAVGAYGMIYRSEDGGASWTLAASGIDNPSRYHYYAIARGADGVLFLSGEAGLLYRSTDGGASWEQLSPGYDGSLFGLVVDGGDGVIAFGLRGNILRSTDGGDSWSPVSVNDDPRLSLYGGGTLGDGTVALVGAGGALLYGAPERGALDFISTPGRNTLSAIAGPDLAAAVAVGMSGFMPVGEALP